MEWVVWVEEACSKLPLSLLSCEFLAEISSQGVFLPPAFGSCESYSPLFGILAFTSIVKAVLHVVIYSVQIR